MKPTRYGKGKTKLKESSPGSTAGSPSIEATTHEAKDAESRELNSWAEEFIAKLSKERLMLVKKKGNY